MKDQRLGGSRIQQLTVALRIRPMNEAEFNENASFIARKLDEQTVVLMDPSEDPDDILRAHRSREKTFVFDKVFDERATQEEVFVLTTKKLIDGVISGYNATVFAYGPTGAGKTYTMLGKDKEPGIYMQTLSDLFKCLEATHDSTIYTVSMSYLEIYNELIRDLLNPSSGFLDLRVDSCGSIQIAGITEISTNNAKKIMQLLTKGNRQRTQEPTAANKTSSRSHAVLQVKVKQRNKGKENKEELRVGRLFMIDLAGSERASQTQNQGKRMKEGAHINRSLLALGNCINALSENGGVRTQFVNFRDSKLTRLLKDSLEGNSRTVMIAHISPASTSFEESRTTLIYADRAKNIKTRVNHNLQNTNYHIAEYSSTIVDLRKEIQRLRSKLEESEKKKENKCDIRNIQAEVKQRSQVYGHQEMEKLRDQLIGAFKEQMKMRRSLIELENINLHLHVDTSKNLLTIADWERIKTKRASRFQKQQAVEGQARVHLVEESGFVEPQDVVSAREEIRVRLDEQQKTASLKSDLEQRLTNAKLKVSQLEDQIPNLKSSSDQQDVLRLLCKVHKLEAGNTELQAGATCKENLLCQKDLVIERYQQHRSMCEEIIRQQLALIEDHDIPVPQSLGNLYRLYFEELQEGNLNRLVQLQSIMTKALKAGCAAEEPASRGSIIQGEIIHPERHSENENGDAKFELPPINFESDRDSVRTSKSSPTMRYESSVSPIAFHLMGPSSGQQRHTSLSLKDIISILRSPTSLDSYNLHSITHNSGSTLSREALEDIAVSTKHISLIAARRRSRAHVLLPSQGTDREKAVSRSSINFLDAEEDSKFLEHMYTPMHRIEGAISLETMLSESQRKDHHTHEHPLRTTITSLKQERLRDMHDKVTSIKKGSHSFEVAFQGKEKSKDILIRKMESVSDLKVPLPVQPVKLFLRSKVISSLSRSTPPAMKIKFPISIGAVDTPLQILEVTSAPPRTIHQINSGQNRGQILQKRVKGPSDSVHTRQIHLTSGNMKQQPLVSARSSVIQRSHVKPDGRKRK